MQHTSNDPATLIDSAADHLRSGRADAAKDTLDGLWRLSGVVCEQWRRAAALLSAGGHSGRAVEALRRAVETDPRDAPSRFALARALRAAGQGLQAVDHLEAGCRIAPADPDGAHLMGVMHLEQGLVDAAVAWLDRARSLGGDSIELDTDLGMALRIAGDLDAAEGAYRRVLERDPAHVAALRGLARIARMRRMPERGLGVLEPCIETSADGGLLAEAADLMSAAGRPAEARRLLESRLPGIESAEGRMEMHFRLGLLLDAEGRYEAAMAQFVAGNRLKDAEFDPGHYAGLIDRLLAAFDSGPLAAMPRASHDDRRPVFIVGMPRSGTSLVEQIIASHPLAHGAGELADLGTLALATRAGGVEYPESAGRLDQGDVDGLAGAYRQRLDVLAPGAERITDKMWQNFEFLGMAELLFPKSRVIHCTRDPLDTGLSCFTQLFHGNGVSFSYDLAHIGAYYRQYRRVMEHWKSVLRLPILDFPYENMVDDVEAGARALLEFIGLPWDDACLRFFDNERIVRTASHDQVRRPVYRSSVGRHRHYDEWLGPLRDALGDSP